MSQNVPDTLEGFCHCGCGRETKICNYTLRSRGWIKGRPAPFVRGHSIKTTRHAEEHYLYKGGRIMRRGYVLRYARGHPMADSKGYVPEHRLVMAEHLDRMLTSNEHIHHINGIKTDNRVENMELVSNSEHRIIHATKWTRETILSAFSKYVTVTGKWPNTFTRNVYKPLPNSAAINRVFGNWINFSKELENYLNTKCTDIYGAFLP